MMVHGQNGATIQLPLLKRVNEIVFTLTKNRPSTPSVPQRWLGCQLPNSIDKEYLYQRHYMEI